MARPGMRSWNDLNGLSCGVTGTLQVISCTVRKIAKSQKKTDVTSEFRRAAHVPPRPVRARDLVGTSIFLRLKDFGWCLGKLVDRVPNRTRKIGGVQVNFIAEFDIDKGAQTDLALELHEYDTSPSADYESWMLLEPEPSAVPAPPPAASA